MSYELFRGAPGSRDGWSSCAAPVVGRTVTRIRLIVPRSAEGVVGYRVRVAVAVMVGLSAGAALHAFPGKVRVAPAASGATYTQDLNSSARAVAPDYPTPRIEALRVESSPRVDGRLNDIAWQEASSGGNFGQYNPETHRPMTQATEFRVVYDDANLYIGVACYDTEPDRILARVMDRDGSVSSDDHVLIVLDPFRDRRNGYWFRVNPNGARQDCLITDNINTNCDWNGIWSAAASIDDEGWKLEVAIPFKTITFAEGRDIWGLNLARGIRRHPQFGRWSQPRPAVNTYNVAEAGELHGMAGARQGLGLDLQPYVLGTYIGDRKNNEDDLDGDIGGDVRYRVSSNLTATASINTDFAETEVDTRQVNLTRFPLFFPEKRAFFLEDSGIFQFGGLDDSTFLPFFSRRIGLSDDGKVVPILFASKLAGRLGRYNVGVLDAVLEKHDGLDTENALVTRVSRNIWEQSSVGMIGTLGDPNTDSENAVLGSDFGYRTSRLFDDQILKTDAFALGSWTESAEESFDGAYGVKVSLPNDLYDLRLAYTEVGEDFRSALGFVPRQGVRSYSSTASWNPRPGPGSAVRQYFFLYSGSVFTDLSNSMETATHRIFPWEIVFKNGWDTWAAVVRQFDAPAEDFEISKGVVIPAGRYYWNDAYVGIQSPSAGVVQVTARVHHGDFYTGERQQYLLNLEILPWKRFNVATTYLMNDVHLPEGDFQTRVSGIRANINFTPDMTWFHFVQYDNASEILGYNTRLQWEFRPGSRFFLVLTQNFERENGGVQLLDSRLSTKLGLTIRF